MYLSPELTGLMWAIALGVIPAAAVVCTLCAVCVKRPATRHALWLVVLLLFITPLTALLPGAPRLPDPIEALAAAKSSQQSIKPATTPAPAPREPAASTAAPLRQAAKLAKPPKDEPRSPRVLTSAPPTTQLSMAPSPEPISAPRSTQPHRRAPIESSPAVSALTPTGSAPANTGVYSFAPSRQAPVRSYGMSSLRSAAPSKIEARREPAPAPSEPSAKPAIERAPATIEPAAADAAPAQVDRYLDRLIGARDAVAAVPPPPGELWLSGVLVILCIAVLRTAWRRRACQDVSPADAETRLLIAACAQRIGLRRAPEALMTARRVSPLVTCGARPRIILPAALWTSLDDRARQAVILHELAHLRRGDHWIRWIEQAVTLAYWWHPVVWWVRSRLRQEADLCCDAWVTSLLPSARRVYAEALISTRAFLSERTDPAPAVGLAMTSARAKRFARRLTMVMTDSARPRTSPLGIVLALAVAAAGTFVVPTLACPNEKTQAAKAPKPTIVITPTPAPAPEPAVSLGVRSAPTPPAPPSAPKPPKAKSPKAPPTPAAPDESSFEQYMRTGADSAALRQLEERLARLEAGIAALHGHGAIARVAPGAPVARGQAGPGWAPSAGGIATTAPDEDGRIKRLYVIPQGKLNDLTELMARSDVPILVSRGDQAIAVYGSSDEHQTFYNFLVLINPDGVKVISEDGEVDLHEKAHEHKHQHKTPAHEGQSSLQQRYDRDLARKMTEEMRAAIDARRAEMDQVRGRMREMQGKQRAIEREAREIERNADVMREQAERLREEAERIRERRSENTEEPELSDALSKLEIQAIEIEAQAEMLEAQYEERENEAESVEEATCELECQLEALAEQIEELVESAMDADDDTESDREV